MLFCGHTFGEYREVVKRVLADVDAFPATTPPSPGAVLAAAAVGDGGVVVGSPARMAPISFRQSC
jgi:hypothetical protein